MSLTLESPVYSFGLGDNKRHYMVVTVPYEIARKAFKADRYKSLTGEGEQRDVFNTHVKKLQREIKDGNFTPTPVTVGLPADLRNLVPSNINGNLKLEFGDTQPLSLLDGGHRTEALERIFVDGDDDVKKQVLALPVTAMVMLDGSTKKDFLNLQLGRSVDRSHILSLSVQEHTTDKKNGAYFEFALRVARLLTSDEKSPFYRQIRFDSAGTGLPISSLSSKGASDIGTSLVGAGKIATIAKHDAQWYAHLFVQVYETIKKYAKELTELGMPLCPPPDGTKGAATMYVGLTNLMAYRLHSLKLETPDAGDLQALVTAAKKTMDNLIRGNFSGPAKRSMLGDFADKFFADLEEKEHHGVPVGLIKTLSTSTFALPKLPKEKKKNGRKPKKPVTPKPVEVEPDFNDEASKTLPTGVVVTEEISEAFHPVLNDKLGSGEADWNPEEAPWEEQEA